MSIVTRDPMSAVNIVSMLVAREAKQSSAPFSCGLAAPHARVILLSYHSVGADGHDTAFELLTSTRREL